MGSLVLHGHDDLTAHPPSQDTFERETEHPSDDSGHRDDLGSLVALCKVTGFCSGLVVKNPPANAGDSSDWGSSPGSGRSPGGGDGNSPRCSCLENPWTDVPGRLLSMGLQRVGHN